MIRFGAAEDYEVAVTSVTIWVKVLDNSGKPVRGLTQSDFEVRDENKRVSTNCFEESVFTPASPLQAASQKYTGPARKFVIFLDLYNSTNAELERVKPSLKEFVKKLGGTNSEVMLAAFLSSGKLGIISRFTPELNRIERLINQAKGNTARDQRLNKNNQELRDLLTYVRPREEKRGFEERAESVSSTDVVPSPDKVMRDVAMANAYQLAQSYYLEEKRITEHSLAAMETFAEDLASNRLDVDEHAAILFISGGVNFNPGRHYFEMIEDQEDREVGPNDIVKFATAKTGTRKQANLETYRILRKGITKLNRANLTVYAINTRGAYVSNAGGGTPGDRAQQDSEYLQDFQDSLTQIAKETGGLSFYNSLNFPLGFQKVLDDVSHHYVLCFSPSSKKKTDEYREIKVICKRPGLTLRHRLGYYR